LQLLALYNAPTCQDNFSTKHLSPFKNLKKDFNKINLFFKFLVVKTTFYTVFILPILTPPLTIIKGITGNTIGSVKALELPYADSDDD